MADRFGDQRDNTGSDDRVETGSGDPINLSRVSPESLFKGEFKGISSIGPTDGVYIAGDRIRGFINKLNSTEKDLEFLLEVVDYFKKMLVETGKEKLVLKTMIATDLLNSNSNALERLVGNMEVILPIGQFDGTEKSYSFVSFGQVNGERLTASQMKQYLTQVERVRARVKSKTTSPDIKLNEMADLLGQGETEYRLYDIGKRYDIKLIEDVSSFPLAQRRRIAELLSPFEYTYEEIDKMIANPANVLALTYLGRRMVGVAVVEKATVMFDGRRFKMVEFTDASVEEAEQGHQIYSNATMFTLLSILKNEHLDLAFTEGNVDVPGIIGTQELQRMKFATSVAADYGWKLGCGILERHVVISGERRNLAVAFFPPEQLQRFKSLLA